MQEYFISNEVNILYIFMQNICINTFSRELNSTKWDVPINVANFAVNYKSYEGYD